MENAMAKPRINKDVLNYKYLIASTYQNNYLLDETNLEPYQQASFYGKATVIKANKNDELYTNIKYLLKSYETIVAFITTDDKFYIVNKYSPTTTRHQRAFAHYYYHQDLKAEDLLNYLY